MMDQGAAGDFATMRSISVVPVRASSGYLIGSAVQ